MPSLMWAQMGIQAVQGVGGYLASREQNKMQRTLQKYQNILTDLSAAMSNNQITRNEAAMRKQAVEHTFTSQLIAMEDESSAKVAAAAAGVSGNSVDQVTQGLRRNAAQRNLQITEAIEQGELDIRDQRVAVIQGANMAQNRDVLARPSLANALLGTSMNLLDTWDAHNPPSRRSTSLLNREP